jgi:hypothetical protein
MRNPISGRPIQEPADRLPKLLCVRAPLHDRPHFLAQDLPLLRPALGKSGVSSCFGPSLRLAARPGRQAKAEGRCSALYPAFRTIGPPTDLATQQGHQLGLRQRRMHPLLPTGQLRRFVPVRRCPAGQGCQQRVGPAQAMAALTGPGLVGHVCHPAGSHRVSFTVAQHHNNALTRHGRSLSPPP